MNNLYYGDGDTLTYRTEQLISQLVKQLKNEQTPDGSWDYPFETGISTDSYMIILVRTLEIDDKNLVFELT